MRPVASLTFGLPGLPGKPGHVLGAQTVGGSQQRRHFHWVPLDDFFQLETPGHRQQFVWIAFDYPRDSRTLSSIGGVNSSRSTLER